MTINVIAWPPVGVVASEWTEDAPTQISRSMLSGAEFRSASRRKRRLASLTVSALAGDGTGAGYMEMLKKHLAGVHAVRLYSPPINRPLDFEARASSPLGWRFDGGDDIFWESSPGAPITWLTGRLLIGTTDTTFTFPRIVVSGFPPNALAARPGEFVAAYATAETTTPAVAQAMRTTYASAGGVAAIRLFSALPALTDVRVNIGVAESAVFLPDAYPRAQQRVRGDWFYSWSFREVFADEVGGFTEIDPWR